MTAISKIEGIGSSYADKLSKIGVRTVEDLLKMGASPKGREDLCEKSGINTKLLLEWVNHADLFRIHGVGEEYSDLLEAAGVDTVPELAQRVAKNLFDRLVKTNEEKKLVRQTPSLSQVEKWVAEAKALPRVITY